MNETTIKLIKQKYKISGFLQKQCKLEKNEGLIIRSMLLLWGLLVQLLATMFQHLSSILNGTAKTWETVDTRKNNFTYSGCEGLCYPYKENFELETDKSNPEKL